MVYNAMKLFMEINPQLFDECSHDYNELQSNAEKREQARQSKWEKLTEQANRMKTGSNTKTNTTTVENPVNADTDATQDSQQRLDALKLHDESTTNKQASVS